MRRYYEHTNPELLSVLISSDSSASKSHLWNFFSMYGPIVSVSEYTHRKGERFGFITFENPEHAAVAAHDAPNHKRFNRDFKLSGKYADAADTLDEDKADLKQLHVRNLHQAITDYSLKALFFEHGCLFSCKPGYWYQQQLNSGVRLPAGAGAPIPNTFVPQPFPGMSPGAGASMPNSWCEIQMESLYPRFNQL
ncbi:polyadenylate-binding protein 4-like [Apium graveolens]|uniref:polyadenylate-binding protein 4-like n=1 Tax=Apium graveolens TaxID=4045 RepID=UPI003D7A20A3